MTNTKLKDFYAALDMLRIRHPIFARATEGVERLHQAYLERGTGGGLMITGESGVGKTSVVKGFLDRRAADISEDAVAYTLLKGKATFHALASAILEALGDPRPDFGTLAIKDRRIRRLIELGPTQVLFIDEIHHVIDPARDKIVQESADWLKSLIDKTGICFVFLGMPSAERLLVLDPQLRRRCLAPIRLTQLGYESAKQKEYFCTLLSAFDKATGLKNAIRFSNEELATRMHLATDGRIALIHKLVSAAGAAAIKSGAIGITMPDLARAYDEQIGDLSKPSNPFAVAMSLVRSQRRRPASTGLTNRMRGADKKPSLNDDLSKH